jgi:microcystin-dependent protein
MLASILGTTYWYQTAPPTPGGENPLNLTLASNIVVPVGGIIEWPAANIPSDLQPYFAICNGQAISRTTYAGLFGILGTTFGSGDGSTTFNLPNYNDSFSIGAGDLYGIGQTGGSASLTLTDAVMPTTAVTVNVTDPGHNHTQNAHNHGVTDPGHAHNIELKNAGSGETLLNVGTISSATPAGYDTDSATTGISTNNATATNNSNTTGITAAGNIAGGANPINTLPPYIAMYKIMRIL